MEKAIKLLGLSFTFLSLALLAFIYLPFISLYFFHPEVDLNVKEGLYITIPKIYAQASVISGVDPWDKQDYSRALEKGVAMAKDFSEPGEKGLIYMFAHSSLPPWQMTRNNVAFLRLNELKKSDEIIITENEKKYVYRVFDKKELWPNEVKLLDEIEGDVLVLQTCTPVGTDLKRLLVFAKLQAVSLK